MAFQVPQGRYELARGVSPGWVGTLFSQPAPQGRQDHRHGEFPVAPTGLKLGLGRLSRASRPGLIHDAPPGLLPEALP